MYKAFLIKYAEIAIKGKNRYLFEDALVRNISEHLEKVEGTFHVRKENGRIYVETEGEYDYDETVAALQKVFGIVGICPVVLVEDEGFESLAREVVSYVDTVYPDKHFTFKAKKKSAAEVVRFVINILVCYGLAYGIAQPAMGILLADIELSVSIFEQISMLFGMGIFVVLNYFGQKFFVFKKS